MSNYKVAADLADVLGDLQRRVGRLERTQVTHGNGVPPTSFTEPYVDDTNGRVYFYVNGVAKSAALT